MPNVVLPNLQTFSEFAPSSSGEVSHGDCGWLALLGAFHVYDRIRYPLTGDALAALRHDAIARGLASANGATNIPQLDAWLNEHGVPHRTYCSYAGPLAGLPAFAGGYNFAELHTLIQRYATDLRSPVIIETSTAGAGLPEDELAVQFHYFTLGGIATPDTGLHAGDGASGGYWRCDGDAIHTNPANSPAPPILTSINEIARTNPVGYLVIDGLPPTGGGGGGGGGGSVSWTIQKDGAGNIVGATDAHGAHAGAGDAAIIAAKYLGTSSLLPAGETYTDGSHSILALDNDAMILATKAASGQWSIVDVAHGGQQFASLLSLLSQCNATIRALQAQLAAQMTLDQAWEVVGRAVKKSAGENVA